VPAADSPGADKVRRRVPTSSHPRAVGALRLLALLALAPLGCDAGLRIGLPDASGALRVEVEVKPGFDLGGVRVSLDGVDVTGRFAPGGAGLVGSLDDPAPGSHRLSVFRPLAGVGLGPTTTDPFDSPTAAPSLVESLPAAGATRVPRSAWPELRFASPPDAEAAAGWGLGVECAGRRLPREAHRLEGARVVLNPRPELRAGASCRIAWRGPGGGIEQLSFSVAPDANRPPATALYDRSDALAIAPIPDDYWLVPDAAQPSGRRIALEPPPYPGLTGVAAFAVAETIGWRDGWSPVQPFVLGFSHPVDDASLPHGEAASLDPAAPIGLFDMDPASPRYGERIGFSLRARSDPVPAGGTDHTLLLFPAETLREGGRYALAVTRRVLVQRDPDLAFGPSAFLRAALLPPRSGEAPSVARARASLGPALEFLAAAPEIPIPPEDLALVLSVSIRSEAFDPADWVSVKEQALAAAPPLLEVESDTLDGGDRVLTGTIALPLYLDRQLVEVTRGPGGAPLSSAADDVPFVFRIPQGLPGPFPVVIYQHGSPGGPWEIHSGFNAFLLEAGYALLGIQDLSNREFGADSAAQTNEIFVRLLLRNHVPLTNFQTHADLFGLVRAIEGMGVPENFPEIDPARIFYRGISFGSHHALGFLPLAPELTAAVGVVGSGRLWESTLHQIDFFDLLNQLQTLLPEAPPSLLMVGLAALQNDGDRDDPYFLARHLYREPLAVAGQTDLVPPSLLWLEGVGDSLVSNNATRAAAGELGIPQLGPVVEAASFLPAVTGPVAENVAPGVTGAHFQYLPTATESCLRAGQLEGHYCPQIADEAEDQTLHFFATAAEGAAEIIDPFAP
jgi:hypothetical protein